METFLREDLIIEALAGNESFNQETLLVAKQLIKTGEVKQEFRSRCSNPISVIAFIYGLMYFKNKYLIYFQLQDVFQYSRQNSLGFTREQIDAGLSLLGMESNNLIRRVGESGGGLFVISECPFLRVMLYLSGISEH
jgi:hypothetical protein